MPATDKHYSVTIVNTNVFDGPPDPQVTSFPNGGAARDWLLEDFIGDDYGRFDGRMAQEAETAEWQLRSWRGEPIKVLGYIHTAYLLPAGDTWEAYEARVAAERKRNEDRWAAERISTAARSANRRGRARIDDPEAFGRRLVELGRPHMGEEALKMVAVLEQSNADDVTDVDPVSYTLRAVEQGWRLRDLELSIHRLRTSQWPRSFTG